ncbi:MAG: hypothetical protein ACRD5D_07875 [Candidatus Polarisedimenticolia bacterium]
MGIVGALVRTAQSYPALLPLGALFLGLAVSAYRRKRRVLALLALVSGGVLALLYTGGLPARAFSPRDGLQPPPEASPAIRKPAGKGNRALPAISKFRPHPRFPLDFPVPATFRVESNRGGSPGSDLSVRFRFRGEGAAAVRALQQLGEANGWLVEVRAPHRLGFHKDGRAVDAWFSYPARSVVLDISEGS